MFSLIKVKNALLDILFPPIEINNAVIYKTLFCPVCRARLPENRKACHKNSSYKLAAAAQYDGDVKKFIWELKYNKKSGAVQPLANVVKNYLDNSELKIKNFSIIPIPLSSNRERERGFNQSLLLAREIHKYTSLPLLENIFIKNKDTKPQAELDEWKDRQTNLENCFSVSESDVINGKNILLVDDVFTSGATLNEAVKTLRASGARHIIGLVIAKAG